jgi:hypothetical protein
MSKISESDFLEDYGTCTNCGSNVSMYLCNSDFKSKRLEAANWDRWVCCDNDRCINHNGEGHFQYDIEWVKKNLNKNAEYLLDNLYRSDGDPLFVLYVNMNGCKQYIYLDFEESVLDYTLSTSINMFYKKHDLMIVKRFLENTKKKVVLEIFVLNSVGAFNMYDD